MLLYRVDHDDSCNDMNKWLTEFCQYIDSQDSLIMDDVLKSSIIADTFFKKRLNSIISQG